MNELFTKLHEFITAAEAKAADVAKKGADVLRGWADWLEKLTSGVMFAESPDDDAELAAYEERLTALASTVGAEAPDPKKIDPATILMIITMVTELIKLWRERKPKP